MKVLRTFLYKFLTASAIICFSVANSHAQAPKTPAPDAKLIQVSGLINTVNDGKSLPVPYVIVKIKNSFRGTIAGVDGFYSVVAKEQDTLEYYALGFKRQYFTVPKISNGTDYTKQTTLEQDTITFSPTDLYPWPTKEQFHYAMLNLKLDDDMTENAKKNLDQAKLSRLYEEMARDGRENQLYSLQKIANSYYYAGGQTNYLMVGNGTPIPASLLNPFAWAQFFQAIKDGKLKPKKDDDPGY